jgi:ribose 5-phosphate isomerase B
MGERNALSMIIYFAADHAGFELKNELFTYVRDELGHTVDDCGAYNFDKDDDYPAFVSAAVAKVSVDPENNRAIILGGSGQGEAMVANRTKGIRAAVYYGGNSEIVTLAREHNNANVLSLGARFLDTSDAKEAVRLWLTTKFSGEERHARRIAQLDLL